jgi:GxxExxY protein
MDGAPSRSGRVVEPSAELNAISGAVVAAAIEVHRALGPGFTEGVYEHALVVEFRSRGIQFARQARYELEYKGEIVGEGRVDFLVAGRVVVELKAVESLAPVHFAQVMAYLRVSRCQLGLLLNFNVPQLVRGVRRVVLSPRACD